MPELEERLWRKEAHHFVIEIQVGNVWVEHSRANTSYEARNQAKEAIIDKSVKAVRVVEHALTHVATKIYEDAQIAILKIPAKMAITDRIQACPKCSSPSKVAYDGCDYWTFCDACQSTMPV